MNSALAAMITATNSTRSTKKRAGSKAAVAAVAAASVASAASAASAVTAPPDFLAKKNVHPRDKFITFDEGPHIYTVRGELGYTSVTTFVHYQFPKFDAEAIVAKILESPKHATDPTYKYYQMTRETILADWDANRDQAARAGTKMHYDIECFYNELNVVNESIEYAYFQKFVADFGGQLKAFRTEWMVYYEEYRLSGSIDMVFENPDGTLQIYDWKRCKSIDFEAFGDATALTPCISHLPDTNFWHYSIQLNMYKRILESKYDKKVTDLYLVCLHPDNPYKTYSRIQVPDLSAEIDALLEAWVNRGKKTT